MFRGLESFVNHPLSNVRRSLRGRVPVDLPMGHVHKISWTPVPVCYGANQPVRAVRLVFKASRVRSHDSSANGENAASNIRNLAPGISADPSVRLDAAQFRSAGNVAIGFLAVDIDTSKGIPGQLITPSGLY